MFKGSWYKLCLNRVKCLSGNGRELESWNLKLKILIFSVNMLSVMRNQVVFFPVIVNRAKLVFPHMCVCVSQVQCHPF